MSSSKPAAFTLLEVLVSLAIFGLAAVVLGATYVNVLLGYERAGQRNDHEQDLRFARAMVLAEPDRRKIEAGGEINLPRNRTARWEAKVEEAPVADLFRIRFRCEIRDPSVARPWTTEEDFSLLRPTWSDPAVRDKLRRASQDRLERRQLEERR